MHFKEYLQISAEEINREIEAFFIPWVRDVSTITPSLVQLVTLLHEGSKGGKRIRGSLVKLGYQISGSTDLAAIIKPAVAVEIFQTAILAHDDIIDKSPLRRGKPTLYKQLGGDHYGMSQTISLGNIGFFLAFKLLSESNFSDTNKTKGIQLFSEMLINTGLGELLDVELPYRKAIRSEKDILMIARLKTAYYTIVCPLQLGAALGGAKDETLLAIKTYGENVGIAFQIQDDILDIFGDEEKIGKSNTADIKEGKNTLLITYALEQASKKQRNYLEMYYGNTSITEKQVLEIRNIFLETGAVAYAGAKAKDFIEKGKSAIPLISGEDEVQQRLTEMADFLVVRTL